MQPKCMTRAAGTVRQDMSEEVSTREITCIFPGTYRSAVGWNHLLSFCIEDSSSRVSRDSRQSMEQPPGW
jgi:hypothetical protein